MDRQAERRLIEWQSKSRQEQQGMVSTVHSVSRRISCLLFCDMMPVDGVDDSKSGSQQGRKGRSVDSRKRKIVAKSIGSERSNEERETGEL